MNKVIEPIATALSRLLILSAVLLSAEQQNLQRDTSVRVSAL